MKSAVLAQQIVAKDTLEVTLARPDGFSFEAGQAIDVTLIDPPETDTEGNMRTFSLVSAPHEDTLRIATRLRDTAFKRSLRSLDIGTALRVEGPTTRFSLPADAVRPIVFIAGGIGITPFCSMIMDAVHRGLPHRMYLFYTNREPQDAAYLAELAQLAAEQSPLAFIPTMTHVEQHGERWHGETGHIDLAMLARYLPPDTQPLYYLAGPQGMILPLRDALTGNGVSTGDISYKEFSGY